MKAMILAAGLGTRLRPITDSVPKPLIEINGKPVIEYTLEALKRAGVDSVIINLHHLGNMIKDRLGDGSRFGLAIRYSPEPEILGTGGAVLAVKALLDETFFLINGDVLFDLDLAVLPPLAERTGADAVMVVRPPDTDQAGIANVYIDKDSYVRGLFTPCPGTSGYVFTGIQLLTPGVLSCIPSTIRQPSTTAHMYPELLRRGGRIAGYVHRGLWTDIGSHESLGQARRIYR